MSIMCCLYASWKLKYYGICIVVSRLDIAGLKNLVVVVVVVVVICAYVGNVASVASINRSYTNDMNQKPLQLQRVARKRS